MPAIVCVIVAMHIEHEPLETCIIIIMATELIQSLLVVVAAVESRVPSKIGTRFHSIPVPNLHMHKRTRGSSLAWPGLACLVGHQVYFRVTK